MPPLPTIPSPHEGEWVLWTVLLVPTFLLLLGASVRRVRRDEMVLVVRSRTRDSVEIVVLANLVLSVEGVPDSSAYDDPVAAAVRVAEHVVAEALRGFVAVTLMEDLPDLQSRLPAEITRRLVPGLVATDLVVTAVEAKLTPRLARELGADDSTQP